MTTTLTRDQGIDYLLKRLIETSTTTIGDKIAFLKPQAEALYHMFTNTRPQQRFPQHQVNLIRINAIHNQHDQRFLERQLACWTTNPFQGIES